MMPPLAAAVGAIVAKDSTLVSNAARIGAAAMTIIAGALLFYSAHRNGFIPHESAAWSAAAVIAGMAGVLFTRKAQHPIGNETVLAAAAAAILGWQLLMCGYSVTPPARSARDLTAQVRPHISSDTALFSVGQYRETIPPYLQRTLTLVEYAGELEYGAEAEPGRMVATPVQFIARWRSSSDAIAFFAPSAWAGYRDRGLPGKVIASDGETIAVSNH
jgi:4-amino-4-deoxy-L-arabinose transferase-like glycosyltransferase